MIVTVKDDIIKELIEQVFEIKLKKLKVVGTDIVYEYEVNNGNAIKYINTYEFLVLLKEWVYDNGYAMYSGVENNNNKDTIWFSRVWDIVYVNHQKSEIDAVLKAAHSVIEHIRK